MSEQLLNVFKILLLVLLYLFFLRVLRAVWSEVREPAAVGDGAVVAVTAQPAPAKKRRRGLVHELVAVEPDALAGRSYPLAPEMTIGRAAGCAVVIDDHFVSSLHARVFESSGGWMVEDLGSTNGTYVNRKKVTGAAMLHRGDQIQIGNVVLEAR